jgi:hypothetical protein
MEIDCATEVLMNLVWNTGEALVASLVALVVILINNHQIKICSSAETFQLCFVERYF